jgi:hypothetical protein
MHAFITPMRAIPMRAKPRQRDAVIASTRIVLEKTQTEAGVPV